MTTTEKQTFIADLCEAVKRHAMQHAHEMPEDWDGHELRAYLSEKFADAASISLVLREPRTKRAREYRNTLTVANY